MEAAPTQTSGANDLLQLNTGLFSDNFTTSLPRSSTFPLADQKQGDAWGGQGDAWGQQNGKICAY